MPAQNPSAYAAAEMTPCPSENELLARVAGTLPKDRAAFVDIHVDACTTCRLALAEAASSAEPEGGRGPSGTFAAREVIADRYIVVKWLATGGMGEVYEVHDTWIDERIALKTIVAAIADDPGALSRLKAEVRIARRVTHANVCRVYDLGFHQRGNEQIAFLTMELLKGVTLRRLLRERGPLSLDAARPLVAQMALALRHAHSAGIVHRDFKSDNVMLETGPDGEGQRVVVMDFGLARQSLVGTTQPLTPQSRTVFGTLDYMSPEQVMGRPASPASDVYSLGVVIYELLTGRLPFEGESPLARALLRVTEKPPPLARFLPTASTELEACVAKCLQLEPEARFATADDLLAGLGNGTVPPATPRPRRSKALFASIAIGMALAALVVQERIAKAPPEHPAAVASQVDTRVDVKTPAPGASKSAIGTAEPLASTGEERLDSVVPAPKGPAPAAPPGTTARGPTPARRAPAPVASPPGPLAPVPEPSTAPAPAASASTADAKPREVATGAGDGLLNPFAHGRRVQAGQAGPPSGGVEANAL
jgi:hypothetical protein